MMRCQHLSSLVKCMWFRTTVCRFVCGRSRLPTSSNDWRMTVDYENPDVRGCTFPPEYLSPLKYLKPASEQQSFHPLTWHCISGLRPADANSSNGHTATCTCVCCSLVCLQQRLPAINDNRLPTAATCSFRLVVPLYSSVSVMRERLLYAISNCTAIDLDAVVVHEQMQLMYDD